MRIAAWSILVEWEDGENEEIADVPSGVAQAIDDFLTEVEAERQNKKSS